MSEKINSKDISVVVQGPIHKTRTKKCLKSIRKQLPKAEIILSTWDDSNLAELDYDILVLNKEPDAVLQKKFSNQKQFCNLNRMILSTNKGIEKATRKYILKLRSDLFLSNTNFLNTFNLFPKRIDEYKVFQKRIVAPTLFTKFSTGKYKSGMETPFHVSDWWFFGLSEDIKKLLLSAELVEEPYFSNYFEYTENKNKNTVYDKFDWKFAPEQYLGYSCFSKCFEDIRMEDCSDISDEIIEKSKICLANNFIFLEYKQSGICCLKYTYSKYEPFCGDQYLDLYSFYNFEKEYKKYCDNSYTILKPNFILEDRDIGYRVLRFYKHLFKLVNRESKLNTRLEQLIIGIPISAITFLPTLIKIFELKLKKKDL